MTTVPIALSQSRGGFKLSSTVDGDLLLYEMTGGRSVEGRYWLGMEQASQLVYAVFFAKLGITGFYISNQTDFTTMPQAARRRISRIEFGPTLMPYGAISASETIESVLGASFDRSRLSDDDFRLKMAKTWFLNSSLPHPAASVRHMRHVTPRELQVRPWEFWVEKAAPAMLMLAEMSVRKQEVTESFFVGLLVWLASLPEQQWRLAQGWKIWRPAELSMAGWASHYKNVVTVRLKALQNNIPVDLTPLFEAEVLVNRGVGLVDWRAEEEHRRNPVLAKFNVNELRRAIKAIFEKSKIAGGKPKPRQWDDYWLDRWTWSPIGSCHSQYAADSQYMGNDVSERTKFYCLNAMPQMSLDSFLSRAPQIRAWPSVKYEWGKQRAIYGVDLTSFIVTGFAMQACEETLSRIFPLGRSAQPHNVKSFVKETLRNGVPYCFDFEDFNTQHSQEAMISVVEMYGEVFGDYMSEDQKRALEWTAESIRDTSVMPNPLLGVKGYSTSGTLMSGWRLTTFVNTVLNAAYIDIATGGTIPASVHNGDDVLSAVTNYGQVQKIHSGAKIHNIRYQKTKCSLGATAEFLRVDHNSGDGSQYLARAVATMVHGPTDMADPYSAKQQMQAFNARAEEVLQRGADASLVADIRLEQYNYLRREGRLEGPNIDPYYLHVTRGGVSREHSLEAISYELTSSEVAGQKAEEETARVLPGVYDYAKRICRLYSIEQYETTIRRRAQQAVNATTGAKKMIARLEKTNATYFDVEKLGLYKLFRQTQLGMKANIAKAFGIPIFAFSGEDTRLIDFLKGSRDPLKALRLLI